MIGRAGLALVLALSAGASAAGGTAMDQRGATHCAKAERVVYSCAFGRKLVSLCLGKQSLHYRFGPLGRPELDLASAPDWSNVRTHQLYSNAFAQEHVRISRGSISYLVHFGEAGRLFKAGSRGQRPFPAAAARRSDTSMAGRSR